MKKLAWLFLLVATIAQASSITTSSGGASIGGPVTGGTAGSVLFIDPASTLAQDNASLFFDNAANRLGIGDATPDAKLDVQGTANEIQARITGNATQTGANHILLVENSAASAFLTITASGSTVIGQNLVLPVSTSSVGTIYGDGGLSTRLLNYFGSGNIFVGPATGNFTLSGADNNAALGNTALASLTSGDNNVGIGLNAGTAINSGINNVFIGNAAGSSVTTANANVGIGFNALSGVVGSSNNTAVGGTALGSASGISNTAIGQSAGSSLSSGTQSTFVGHASNTTAATAANQTAIGDSANVAAANTLVLGDIAVASFLIGSDRTTTGAATARTLHAGDAASGQTNQAGGNLTIQGSRGTGSSSGGSLIFATAPAGASGTTLGTPANRLTIGADGTVSIPAFTIGTVESNNTGALTSTNVWTSTTRTSNADCTTATCTQGNTFGGAFAASGAITRSAVGTYTVTYSSGTFWSAIPVCVVVSTRGADIGGLCIANGPGNTTVLPVVCFTASTGAAVDSQFAVNCQGSRT